MTVSLISLTVAIFQYFTAWIIVSVQLGLTSEVPTHRDSQKVVELTPWCDVVICGHKNNGRRLFSISIHPLPSARSKIAPKAVKRPATPEGHSDVFPFSDRIDSQLKWSRISVHTPVEIATALSASIDYDQCPEHQVSGKCAPSPELPQKEAKWGWNE